MMSELVRCQVENGIAVVTINNPPINAMTAEAWTQLDHIFYKLSTDESLRCVILTGECEKNLFVGGSNVKEFLALDAYRGSRYTQRNNGIRFHVYDCPVPVICALNGSAIGGGMGLALMCDYRIAPPDAKFGVGEINMGLLGFTQFLAHRVHVGIARKMVYTGYRVTGEEGVKIGLIDEVAPREEIMDRAMELAKNIARQSPLAVRYAKECMKKAEEAIFAGGGQEYEDERQTWLWATEDQKEAVTAFLEKRDPQFKCR